MVSGVPSSRSQTGSIFLPAPFSDSYYTCYYIPPLGSANLLFGFSILAPDSVASQEGEEQAVIEGVRYKRDIRTRKDRLTRHSASQKYISLETRGLILCPLRSLSPFYRKSA
ncbi:hypothetical protein H112_05053 [Trichophyton rubrum D6]|uniref:Uncharacterized protein n=3 Tax=Trichophyton TaxID=5550 RepID=A0A080WRY9_TRIRC|nr:uncharacterized protein TERG_11901 [Trichophyton rubrum CBS 118892]EZF21879.1 hypothetical protein H100_05076 [Trichophyton rubrum MR850]EZF41050.1 hypothetical protein H102_05062 [Trichophyton rubrum CBS 100081]EZF51556.1 hypothetical protein H103_05064 [Trichophyton rubrum CBS 288.86]EZF62301.1 hypothetical protein H104_05057 [Trichophyton rubrum CBS 289.86]EZF72800.1 hypothetical protein H105_05083 [Trichophyton soudanense CBS 452.61]EZF83516.1 hypothetical protein H110_05063 [Trichophy